MKNTIHYLLPILLITTAYICAEPFYYSRPEMVDQNQVVFADPGYTFALEFRALFFKPSSNSLTYAVEAVPLPVASPHWNIFAIRPGYHFGFDLGVNCICPGADENMALRWEHFKSSSSDAQQVGENNMIGPFFEIGPDALPYTQAEGNVKFNFDMVNLTFEHYVQLGQCLETSIYGGISFARIKQRLISAFSNSDGTIVRTINVPARFTGAGPLFGVNFAYNLCRDFHFIGNICTSVLMGKLKNNTTFEALSPALAELGITPPNTQSTTVETISHVVPAIEERLGLAYFVNFCRCYWLKLEVGYEAKIYLNALQSIDIGSEVITPPVTPDTIGVFARTFERHVSNFALSGPYIAFSLEF